MIARVAPLLARLPSMPYRRLAIVSHGGLGKAMLTHLLGLGPESITLFAQPNDVIYRLDFSTDPLDCTHFRGPTGPHPGLFAEQRHAE
jgi:broad specificity phosphatase PhoE